MKPQKKRLTHTLKTRLIRTDAQIAQLVEQGIENPRVGGSIPPLGTIIDKASLARARLFIFGLCARFVPFPWNNTSFSMRFQFIVSERRSLLLRLQYYLYLPVNFRWNP